jgi:peptide-methionine (S)-S-oxide reductase
MMRWLAIGLVALAAACSSAGRTQERLTVAEPGYQPSGTQQAIFAMGCFWGAEEHFFHVPGVVATAVGYAGGKTANPTYDSVHDGDTGHAEVVRVVFDPKVISYDALLRIFWEQHDPTQGMRQGNDVGTMYRSAIYTFGPEQQQAALASRDEYAKALASKGYGAITTEIAPAGTFWLAEDYHQQYCAKNPEGYCHHGGTGVHYPSP